MRNLSTADRYNLFRQSETARWARCRENDKRAETHDETLRDGTWFGWNGHPEKFGSY